MAAATRTYSTLGERSAILAEMTGRGYRLVSESNVFDKPGDTERTNSLTFADEPLAVEQPGPPSLEQRLSALEVAVAELRKGTVR